MRRARSSSASSNKTQTERTALGWIDGKLFFYELGQWEVNSMTRVSSYGVTSKCASCVASELPPIHTV